MEKVEYYGYDVYENGVVKKHDTDVQKIRMNNTYSIVYYDEGKQKMMSLLRFVYKAFNREEDISEYSIRSLKTIDDEDFLHLSNLYKVKKNRYFMTRTKREMVERYQQHLNDNNKEMIFEYQWLLGEDDV